MPFTLRGEGRGGAAGVVAHFEFDRSREDSSSSSFGKYRALEVSPEPLKAVRNGALSEARAAHPAELISNGKECAGEADARWEHAGLSRGALHFQADQVTSERDSP